MPLHLISFPRRTANRQDSFLFHILCLSIVFLEYAIVKGFSKATVHGDAVTFASAAKRQIGGTLTEVVLFDTRAPRDLA